MKRRGSFAVAVELASRAAESDTLEDWEAAISAILQALQFFHPGDLEQPSLLGLLASALDRRYHYNHNLADLKLAIRIYQQVLQVTSSSDTLRPELLRLLGRRLRVLYKHTNNLEDLEASISACQQALQVTSLEDPEQPDLLNDLGYGLRDHYYHTGSLEDLEASISVNQQALDMISPDSPERPNLLNDRAVTLRMRFEHTGSLEDLDAAIDIHYQALQITPKRPGLLNMLSIALLDRSNLTGNLADLEASISANQQALQMVSSDSPERPGLLNMLGIGLSLRYDRTRNLTDLETAITAHQQALQMTPPDSPNRLGRLGNLGNVLRLRFDHTGNPEDLDAAITVYQQALQITPLGDPERPMLLSNLGIALEDSYSLSENLTDLEAAIATQQQALEITPADAPHRSDRLNRWALGLRRRYERTRNLEDLETAINALQQALQTPASYGHWGLRNNLGTALRVRYNHTGNVADLEAAITAWETNWAEHALHFAALPVTYKLGQQDQDEGLSSALVTAYLDHAAQHHSSTTSDLRSALLVTESHKSRLLTQLVGRGPLPLPSGLSSHIAQREQQLLANLSALDIQELTTHSSTQEETSHLQRLQQRQATLLELENIWTHITRLGPEGSTYVALRRGTALTWPEYADLAKELGPATVLISFFTTADRALLFLLRAGWRAPRVIEVPLSPNGWIDLLNDLVREVYSYDPDLNNTWDRPLLPPLKKAQRYLQGIERLILAPDGIGHLLPWVVLVERAGWRTPTGQLLPLVILPALSILPRLQKRPRVSSGPALVIGNPTNPDYHDLPHAEKEAALVAEQFGTNPLLREAATKSKVLNRFPDARLIHLATHAFFDHDDPLKSGIVLADGVLTAREILQYRLHADLLVLSACESGQVGSLGGEELAGLSQTFLQAGVRSLLVSLWEVNDPATSALLRAFYTYWQERGVDKAQALRQAMTQIQQDRQHLYWSHPYYWGAFVLVGDWD